MQNNFYHEGPWGLHQDLKCLRALRVVLIPTHVGCANEFIINKLQYSPKVPGTLSKSYEKLQSYQHFNHYALNVPPFPLKQCCSVPGTFGIIAHEKIFHFPIYFSQKSTLFKGRRGTNVLSRLKICKVFQDFWRVL